MAWRRSTKSDKERNALDPGTTLFALPGSRVRFGREHSEERTAVLRDAVLGQPAIASVAVAGAASSISRIAENGITRTSSSMFVT